MHRLFRLFGGVAVACAAISVHAQQPSASPIVQRFLAKA